MKALRRPEVMRLLLMRTGGLFGNLAQPVSSTRVAHTPGAAIRSGAVGVQGLTVGGQALTVGGNPLTVP
jgi:hypothetical protein